MSVLGNAKSNSHRKTHQVELGGTGQKMFMHLTRGDLHGVSDEEVSRGHSSEQIPGNREEAKGRRTKREQSATGLCQRGHKGDRNAMGVSPEGWAQTGESSACRWIPVKGPIAVSKFPSMRKEAAEDAQ
jgi:hypothetical protein